MRRLLGVLLAFGLAVPVIADGTVVCTATPHSGIGFSETTLSASAGLQCDRPAAGGGAPSSLLDGLVSYWKLDEASGTREDTPGSNDLTDNNTVGSAAGILGNAASFVAANSEYLSHTDNAPLSTGDIDFTFAYWVNLNNNNTRMTLVGKDVAGGREYELNFNSTRFEFDVFNGVDTQLGQVANNNLGLPSTGTWYFLVVWHDATANTVNIAANAGTANVAATSGAVGDGNATFNLGRRSYAGNESYLDGFLDEVGFWKRVLTTAERACLYGGGTPPAYPFTGVCN